MNTLKPKSESEVEVEVFFGYNKLALNSMLEIFDVSNLNCPIKSCEVYNMECNTPYIQSNIYTQIEGNHVLMYSTNVNRNLNGTKVCVKCSNGFQSENF